MQVFVAGTWSDAKARDFQSLGIRLGQYIADWGVDLACGPGTGIAKHVIAGYRSVPGAGRIRVYLPSREEMRRVGEEIALSSAELRAIELIETAYDYPMRNVFQVSESQALFLLTGGDGTLEEVITALADYHLPVAAYREEHRNCGTAVEALARIAPLFPAWSERLTIGSNIPRMLAFLGRYLGAPLAIGAARSRGE